MSNEPSHLREFGKFRVDLGKKVLWYGDEPVNLSGKPVELLCVLVESEGEIVTKSELLDKVWPDSFVEESVLSQNVHHLRKTLRDLASSENLIQTIPRRGYRFTGQVREVSCGDDTITIEKYTHSQTLIEIQDDQEVLTQNTRLRPSAGHLMRGPSAYRLFVTSIIVLVAISAGVVAFSAFRIYSGAASSSGIRSIAVLPFRTIDPNTDTVHDSLGMADLLSTRLSNIKEITVRPISAVASAEGQDPVTLGRSLQTDAVLEGSIYRSDDKVRVTARLLKTLDSSVVWTGEFERLIKEEMKLQDEVTLQVANALTLNLSGREKAAIVKPLTGSPTAATLYQQGRVAWNKRNTEGMLEAERLFRSAIKEDPNFAIAYVGLADIFGMASSRHHEIPESIRKALEIDPELGEAYASLGFYETFANWEWECAEEAFKKAIELNPNYATAHHWYAQLLAIQGRFEEAKAEMRRALEIDPLSYNYLADLGQIYYFNHEYSEAEKYCRKALEIYPDFVFARVYLHQIYLKTGQYELAVEELLAAETSSIPTSSSSELSRKQAQRAMESARTTFREGGINSYMEARVSDVHDDPNYCYHYAVSYSFLGRIDDALTCLEKAHAGRAFHTIFVKAEPAFDILRSDPRYTNILLAMKLAR